jgi:hypothetical protein
VIDSHWTHKVPQDLFLFCIVRRDFFGFPISSSLSAIADFFLPGINAPASCPRSVQRSEK